MMKTAILAAGVALSLLAAPAFANGSAAPQPVDLETLSDAQLDALVSILSGLPRQ